MQGHHQPIVPSVPTRAIRFLARALALGLAAAALHSPLAQAVAVATAPAPQLQPGPGQRPAGAKVAQAPAAPARNVAETRPAWAELTGGQQKALQPLAGSWNSLSEAQKRKWIALSQNYDRLAPEEQAKLHSRMSEWVALSPQQRAQARLNFGESRKLSRDDKKAKWEAYQALSPDEKRKLAAGANTRTPPTAAAVKPIPAQKLANVPRGSRENKPPRIASGLAPDRQPAPAQLPPQPQAN